VIRGTPARWPPFTRVFPVVVFPEPPGRETGSGGRTTQEAAA
jgi:hypothetical protein